MKTEICHEWMSHVAYEWVMSRKNGSGHALPESLSRIKKEDLEIFDSTGAKER